jgi:Outer membrane protein beta-barrel domain
MKKMILILVAIASITVQSKAQNVKTDNASKFHFGIKGGVNVSNVYVSKGEDFVAKAGVAIGAFAQIPLGSIIGIQPEILYSQKGFKGTGTILGSPYRHSNFTCNKACRNAYTIGRASIFIFIK